ncbi:MAG: magnesium protoporphyrin IX methyltransferase [Hyphomicrobium sp.]
MPVLPATWYPGTRAPWNGTPSTTSYIIRRTVRAGRDQMRANILAWLPDDMRGRRLLDAGCGTGALAVEAAKRGADVTAIDLSPALVELARDRSNEALRAANLGSKAGRIDFHVGDMLDPALGHFHHVVAMDSLIHYTHADVTAMLAQLSGRTSETIVFTFAPRTPALTMMHALGRFFPRQDRAPAIEPVDVGALRRHLAAEPALSAWEAQRTSRIDSGFYISQALELAAR